MDGLKSKYYKDIKAGVKLTHDQQEAIDFFNTHNEERDKVVQLQNERKSIFQQKTDC